MRSYHVRQAHRYADLSRAGFLVEPRYYFYGWSNSPRLYARKSAAQALAAAQALLPPGYKFKIWDAQRPREVHDEMLESFRKRLQLMHPGASRGRLRELVYRFGGKARAVVSRLDTHRNGGAFDLTVVDGLGGELFMGSDHDDLSARASLDYFEGNKRLTTIERQARDNRRLLRAVMSGAGFKKYLPEWWHWSYDK
jgi:D-alanyl-D-alanine dipeptidase